MTTEAAEVHERANAVLSAGTELRARSIEDRVRWLAEAAEAFLEGGALEAEAKQTLPDETGCSPPMVAWGLKTTFETIKRDELIELYEEARESLGPRMEPISLLAVVLAGNVFSAAVRGVFVPLLFGVPVLAKAASNETVFPSLLRRALRDVDPELGQAVDVVVFAREDTEEQDALFELAEAVSVFGTDETIEAVQARVDGRIPVLAHGHGVSAAYCGARALGPSAIDETASRVALDIAAYDQRGCLSPQVIYVERTDESSVDDFAARLSGALEALSGRLPRGALPPPVAATQTQWRGTAEVEASLIGGHEHALAVRGDDIVRWSPGYRNATIVAVSDFGSALDAMQPFAQHLKCIGVDQWTAHDLLSHGSTPEDSYLTELGTMQTPALDAPADGKPVWQGLLRTNRS